MYKKKNYLNLKKRRLLLRSNKKLLAKNLRKYRRRDTRNGASLLSRIDNSTKTKILRSFLFIFILIPISLVSTVLLIMNYISHISQELPSPDNPFQARQQSSIIYGSDIEEDGDRSELYRIYDTENRNLVMLENVPDHVIWSVLAAEDIDFYEHAGFDVGGIYKAVMYNVFGVGEPRGGSTITQQLIKQTTLGSEVSYERKIKELLLSIKVEQQYTKDEILEMYLNTNNYGGNVYGIKTASKFYFGKEVKDLTLSEAALLARIPQNPANNSPTLSLDPKSGLDRAFAGREFVLDQMSNNITKINDNIESDDNLITAEDIEAARVEELEFLDPKVSIKAGHFVFYVQSLLTKKPYNNGNNFTLKELQTGGYKIYTTLDTDIQRLTEENVRFGVDNYSAPRGGMNGAAIVVNPQNGDILSMVGSKDFFGQSEGKLFEPKVNVTTTLQSMGSSMKPIAYYKGFEMGLISAGSYLPDVPISIGNYRPKNWDNSFNGYSNGANPRNQLRRSRNIPAVMIVDTMGISNYTRTLDDFGYFSIAQDPSQYGSSLVLGGGDITMVEHAQGYTVFANGGKYIELDPIKKITKFNDITGQEDVIYEKEVTKRDISDSRAIYMVNHILNYKNDGPGDYIDGRDHAGKTGTSELHKDTVYAGYTPELVILGWNGNNDNTPMVYGSWGENVTKPWVIKLTRELTSYFPDKTPFLRPGGITTYNGDLSIEGLYPNNNIYRRYAPPPPTPTPTPTSTPPTEE